MTQPLASAIASQQTPAAGLRIGRVISFDTGYVNVAVSGASVLLGATYLIGGYTPVVGDIVLLTNLGSQWVVLGELSANPEINAVKNNSFEDIDQDASFPYHWTSYIPAGQSVDMAVGYSNVWGNMIDGQFAAYVQADFINDASVIATGTAYVISDLFSVTEGDLWSLSGWVTVSSGASYNFAETQADIFMYIYSNPDDTYPTSTPVTSFSVIEPGLIAEGIWLKLSASYPVGWGGFRIPTGGAYGQIVCQGSCTRRPISGLVETSVVMYFDRIQAMRVGNVGAEVTG